MNGASDVPPICAHPAQQESIITLFLAGRTHSQSVPDIILRGEYILLHHICCGYQIMGLSGESGIGISRCIVCLYGETFPGFHGHGKH